MTDVIELPPGLRVIERGWLSANSLLFADESTTALIDSGYCSHSDQTLALVALALGPRPLDLLLNTHLHSDHCGGNFALQQRYPGIETRIPPGQADHVRRWNPVALSYTPTGQECPPFQIQGVLESGGEVMLAGRAWQIHASPGHDPHSVILFEAQSRTLASADALWENGFGVVFQELEGQDTFDSVAQTLNLIERLAPLVVIPGHGKVFTHVSQSLAAARRRLDAFVRDPIKHATHAAKVLLKFKLLELQSVPLSQLRQWALVTPYFSMVHQRWFQQLALDLWIDWLAQDLIRTGAARRTGDVIHNV